MNLLSKNIYYTFLFIVLSTNTNLAAKNLNPPIEAKGKPVSCPMATVTAVNNNVCKGYHATLSATGCDGTTTVWYDSPNQEHPIGTGLSISVWPSSTTTYYAACEREDWNCRLLSAGETIHIIESTPAPTWVQASEPIICETQSTVLQAVCSYGDPVFFTDNALTIPVLDTRVSGLSPGPVVYYAACDYYSCLSSPVALNFQVLAEPTEAPELSASSPLICPGESSTLSADCSVGTPVWYADAEFTELILVGSNITVNPVSTTDYYAHCQNAYCYSPEESISISVFIPTELEITVDNTTICQGAFSTLTASECSSGSVIWYSDIDLTNDIGDNSSLTVSPAESSTYYAVCQQGHCKSPTVAQEITVIQNPTEPLNASVSKTNICDSESVTLSATCNSGTAQWFQDAQLTIPQPELEIPGLSAGTYTYYVICNFSGCQSSSSSTSVIVTETPQNPTGLTASKTSLCSGETTSLSASCSQGNVSWFADAELSISIPGSSPLNVSPVANTSYYAICQNGACKSNSENILITVNPTPSPPTALTSSSDTIKLGESFDLSASCSSGTLKWYENNNETSEINPQTITPNEVGAYKYYGICEDNNCKSSAEEITVIVETTPVKAVALYKGSVAHLGEDNFADEGEIITYTFAVENIGIYDLQDVEILEFDSLFSGTGLLPVPVFVSSDSASTEGNLKVGEIATYTADYVLTLEDVKSGRLQNQAAVIANYAPLSGARIANSETSINSSSTIESNKARTITSTPATSKMSELSFIEKGLETTNFLTDKTSLTGSSLDFSTYSTLGATAVISSKMVTEFDVSDISDSSNPYDHNETGFPSNPEESDATDSFIPFVEIQDQCACEDILNYEYQGRFFFHNQINIKSYPGLVFYIDFDSSLGLFTKSEGLALTDSLIFTEIEPGVYQGHIWFEKTESYSLQLETTDNRLTAIENSCLSECIPTISLTKASFADVGSDGFAEVGDEIKYNYAVRNIGEQTLTDVKVEEEPSDFTGTGTLPSPIFVSASQNSPEGTLYPGETATYTATYYLTAADISSKLVNNQALATAKNNSGIEISDLSDSSNPNDPNETGTPGTPEESDPTGTVLEEAPYVVLTDSCSCFTIEYGINETPRLFDIIQIHSESNETWTIKSQTGGLTTDSTSEVALALGSELEELSEGIYQLKLTHQEENGYSISFENQKGYTLNYSNACAPKSAVVISNQIPNGVCMANGVQNFGISTSPSVNYTLYYKNNLGETIASGNFDPSLFSEEDTISVFVTLDANDSQPCPISKYLKDIVIYKAEDCNPSTDIEVIKTVDNSSPLVNENITYRITVTNKGNLEATNLSLSESPDAGIRIISATSSTGAVWEYPNLSIASLAPDESITLSIIAQVILPGISNNSFSLDTLDQTDDNDANNSSTVCISAPYTVCKTDGHTLVPPNGHTGVKWFRNDKLVGSGTTLTVYESGSYYFTSDQHAVCNADHCCPTRLIIKPCCQEACIPIRAKKIR